MKIKDNEYYYALLCDCGVGKDRYMICGIFCSRKEANEYNKTIKSCVAKHLIKRCKLELNF